MSDPKLYIVMRSDLRMGRGKEIAQAIHAYRFMSPLSEQWASPKMPVICVRADSEDQLLEIMAEAGGQGCFVSPVRDAGHTHNEPGTLTCAAILVPFGQQFPTLSAAKLY